MENVILTVPAEPVGPDVGEKTLNATVLVPSDRIFVLHDPVTKFAPVEFAVAAPPVIQPDVIEAVASELMARSSDVRIVDPSSVLCQPKSTIQIPAPRVNRLVAKAKPVPFPWARVGVSTVVAAAVIEVVEV